MDEWPNGQATEQSVGRAVVEFGCAVLEAGLVAESYGTQMTTQSYLNLH